jgi:hypothetical protein
MKSIELTKEHRSKLIEMCEVLFSEYNWQFASDYGTINDDTQVDSLIQWKITDKHSQRLINTFHWFEFCMTHLPVELYRYAMHKCNLNPVDAFKIITFNLTQFEDFGRYEINPINFLYQEFKKLNNEKK